MCINKEAVISIILPTLLNDEQDVVDIINRMKEEHGDSLRIYIIPFDEKTETAIVISDRDLDDEEVIAFYEDIMEYHHETDDLSENEVDVRDQEVKDKWLNGKFTLWTLSDDHLKETECCCSCCNCEKPE
jgi:hypothetical protein